MNGAEPTDRLIDGRFKLLERLGGGGMTTRTPGGTTTDSQKPVDLNSYDWNTLPALLRASQNTLKVPHPTSRYLIIEPDLLDGTPVIAVYLSDNYGSGYLTATPHGTIKTTYPRGS